MAPLFSQHVPNCLSLVQKDRIQSIASFVQYNLNHSTKQHFEPVANSCSLYQDLNQMILLIVMTHWNLVHNLTSIPDSHLLNFNFESKFLQIVRLIHFNLHHKFVNRLVNYWNRFHFLKKQSRLVFGYFFTTMWNNATTD